MLKRLRLMSPAEVFFYRIPQQIQKTILGRFQSGSKLKPLEPSPELASRTYSRSVLDHMFSRDEFNTILPIFDIEVDWENITSWRKDFKSEIVSNESYYNKINKQEFESVGDIKYVAEISRFHFLPFGALKYLAHKDPHQLNLIKSSLISWTTQNPYLRSIHWTSGIEVAIRSVNLIITYEILTQEENTDPDVLKLITRHLHYNYRFLKNHLSLYSSANNHLMAELMGLVVISSVFKTGKGSLDFWSRKFFEQVLAQVHEDGVHMELSTRYHCEVTDQILIAFSYLKRRKVEIPVSVWERFGKMFDFINHIPYNGCDAVFGDDDQGSVIFPHFVQSYSLYESLLQSADHLLGTSYNRNGEVDFRNYLLFGDTVNPRITGVFPKEELFDKSGYCFMYDHEQKLKVSFDVGTIGDRISAAHGHSDLLHFTLQLNGQPVIIDPGTYQYHSKDIFWRDYFRGITAHNCIAINGEHHAQMNNRMSWLGRPVVNIEEIELNSDLSFCAASHNAYAKFGVETRRRVELNKTQRKIVIEDTLVKKRPETAVMTFFLHFHPDVKIERSGTDQWDLITNGQKLRLYSGLLQQAELVRGDDEIPLGWYSPGFGVRIPTNSLMIRDEFGETKTIVTEIRY